MVSIEIIGSAKAEVDKVGLLLQPVSEIEIEALPEDLPEHIEVNVKALAAVDDQITIESIKPPKGVTILTDPTQVIVKIGELVSKEAQEQAAAEEAAAEAAKATSDVAKAEGAEPSAGGAKPEAPDKTAKEGAEAKPAEEKPEKTKTASEPAKEQQKPKE